MCRRKEVEVINAEACADHIHMCVSIPPKLSVSSFMGYLKGKSMVGNNKAAVYNYVQNQLKEDMISDQITIKEYKDPFKG
jgi:putative transposase